MNRFFWVKRLVKRALCFPLMLFHPGSGGIRILMYHRVTDEVQTELAVSKGRFNQQMEYLAQKAIVISLTDAIELLKKNEKLKDSYVVLTFDDGYEDIYSTVFPVLSNFNIPATVFLPVGFISSQKVFWWDEGIGYSNTLKLGQVMEIYQAGIMDFHSHTINHYDLSTVDSKILESEICESRNMLASLLDREIQYFAYPRGIYTPQALEFVKQHYKAAVSSIIGTNNSGTNLYLLKRIPIDRSDDMTIFKLKVQGKFETLYRLRKFRVLDWLWEKAKFLLTP